MVRYFIIIILPQITLIAIVALIADLIALFTALKDYCCIALS